MDSFLGQASTICISHHHHQRCWQIFAFVLRITAIISILDFQHLGFKVEGKTFGSSIWSQDFFCGVIVLWFNINVCTFDFSKPSIIPNDISQCMKRLVKVNVWHETGVHICGCILTCKYICLCYFCSQVSCVVTDQRVVWCYVFKPNMIPIQKMTMGKFLRRTLHRTDKLSKLRSNWRDQRPESGLVWYICCYLLVWYICLCYFCSLVSCVVTDVTREWFGERRPLASR